MPGKHTGHPTIAFRPSSDWQYKLIEERALLSGMQKKDFITRSCIYSNICVVGTKKHVQKIVDSTRELQDAMYDIVSQLKTGDILISDETFEEFKNELLVLCITVVDILDGAAYLFGENPRRENTHWKADLELEQFRKMLAVEADKEMGYNGEKSSAQ